MQVRFANKPATAPGVTAGLTPDEAEMDRCGLSHASLPRIPESIAPVSCIWSCQEGYNLTISAPIDEPAFCIGQLLFWLTLMLSNTKRLSAD